MSPTDDDAVFWRTLDEVGQCTVSCQEVHDRIRRQFSSARVRLLHLERMLARCSEQDVARFHRDLTRLHHAAWRKDLWTAFDLMFGGLSTIELAEAISWLVLQGRATYTAVLDDPDRLAGLAIEPQELRDACGIDSVAEAACRPDPAEDPDLDDDYLRMVDESGARFEPLMYFDPPHGDPLPADLDALRPRFPRITDQYFPSRSMVLPPGLPSLAAPGGPPNRPG